jgi:hypothetical protein
VVLLLVGSNTSLTLWDTQTLKTHHLTPNHHQTTHTQEASAKFQALQRIYAVLGDAEKCGGQSRVVVLVCCACKGGSLARMVLRDRRFNTTPTPHHHNTTLNKTKKARHL